MTKDPTIDSLEEALIAYGHLIVCNQTFREMYNYTEVKKSPGAQFQGFGRIVFRQGRFSIGEAIGEDYLDRTKANRERLTSSFNARLKDDHWISLTYRRMNNCGFVSVHVDVTKVNEFEANMEQARRQAEAASQAKTSDLDSLWPKDGLTPYEQAASLNNLTREVRII